LKNLQQENSFTFHVFFSEKKIGKKPAQNCHFWKGTSAEKGKKKRLSF
jgi:hypothetical protein